MMRKSIPSPEKDGTGRLKVERGGGTTRGEEFHGVGAMSGNADGDNWITRSLPRSCFPTKATPTRFIYYRDT
jgi:hypothetical protein